MAQETPRRRNSLRAGAYNYAWAGSYFVTICVNDRLPRFGQVIDGEMSLNDPGTMVANEWQRLPERFSFVQIDAFVVMPNHWHGIVVIDSCTSEFDPQNQAHRNRANTRFAPTSGGRAAGTGAGALSRVIQGFKSDTTGLYIRGVKESGWEPYDGKLWQRSFYDHIIRDDRDLQRIRTYIDANPARWFDDTEYVSSS